jgi:microcystin-dependent protein
MTKITALSADTSPSLDDLLLSVDNTSGTNKKVTISDLITLLSAQVLPVGKISPYGGRSAPSGWLFCYGQAVVRTDYPTLFTTLVPTVGTATVTIASPAVFTLNAHGFQNGDTLYLTTTGALPTGLAANTLYYVKSSTTNTFRVAATRGGADINTTGSQSGVHTVRACPFGLGDGSTTFNIPDARGRVLAGNDSMGGTAAARLSLAQTQGVDGTLGATGGEQGHVIVLAEMAAHNHNAKSSGGAYAGGAFTSSDSAATTQGSDTAHNNVQPTQITNYIIKT